MLTDQVKPTSEYLRQCYCYIYIYTNILESHSPNKSGRVIGMNSFANTFQFLTFSVFSNMTKVASDPWNCLVSFHFHTDPLELLVCFPLDIHIPSLCTPLITMSPSPLECQLVKFSLLSCFSCSHQLRAVQKY